MKPAVRIGALFLSALIMAGCASLSGTPTAIATTAPATAALAKSSPAAATGCKAGDTAYPANSQDGNHFVDGAMDLPNAHQLRVEIGGELLWLVGLGERQGSRWLVSDSTGRIAEVVLQGEQAQVYDFDAGWPQAAPLAAQRTEAGIDLLGSQLQPFSPLSQPVRVTSQQIARLAPDGQLNLVKGGATQEVPLMGLPDARLLADGLGNLAFYTNPTGRYPHGALGDELEAAGLAVVRAASGEIAWSYQAPSQAVFEGVAPLWVDLDQDGRREFIATVSTADSGARYSVIDQSGERGSSPAIGQGFRWRHAIAAAPLAPDGSWELVGVRTPHLGGIVEYLAWRDDALVVTAELPGYSSHQLGSRNLDQALVADFDADGRFELLLPTQDFTALAAISRIESGAVEAWRLPLPATLATNLAAACHRGEGLALAAGLEDGSLIFWLPE